MGKLSHISTELWPLIYVKLYLENCDQLSSNFVYGFISGRSELGLKMGKFRQRSIVMALYLCSPRHKTKRTTLKHVFGLL